MKPANMTPDSLVIVSIEAAYQSSNSAMLYCERYSSLPLPKTIQRNGETLTLFSPASGPKSLLRISREDLGRLKQPYQITYRKGFVHIKGQRIKTELIGCTANNGVLCNRNWDRIGTWEISPPSFTLD